MTELELTARLKEGDNTARKELYERFAPAMLSLCRRYVGSRYEAEDVLHDGFLLAFRVIEQFTYRGDGSLAAWLRRVFTNHVLSHLEKERRIQTDDADLLADETGLADDDTPPPDISADRIIELIGELPLGYRTVINLFLVEGWSHAEIARKLHIKESTSASQYLRGKKLLKEKITHYLQTHEQ